MDNFFFGKNKFSKSESNQEFSEISSNYSRTYSKGKSFKFSIWNEVDTYNNDDFVQDFVQWNQKLWAAKKTSTNILPTQGEYWELIVEGVSDVEFKQEDNRILWKYEDESEWKDLFELDVVSESEIKNMLKDIATDVDSNFYDKTLSETSVNAVQNKVITQALNKKQDVISDLSEIRNKAKSALQSVPSEYVTESELANKGYLTEHQDISGKQDKIADLAQIRANAQKGATALQTVPAEYATKTDVSKEVAKIVNSAPEAFNTLKEIADWIEEDAEPAIVLANKVEQKVDKVEGLGLSEENYTTEEKDKLAGLENYDDAKLKEELSENYQPKENIYYLDWDSASGSGELDEATYQAIMAADKVCLKNGISITEPTTKVKNDAECAYGFVADKRYVLFVSESNYAIIPTPYYDDTELREAIEGLDNRLAAHSEEIVNLQENKADKSELTELSAEVDELSEKIDNLPSGESSVFEAIYGETTFEEVSEAYNQGKIIHCDYESRCYELAVFTGNIAWFSCVNTTTSYLLMLNANSSWSKASYGLEDTGNRVDTIQADAKPYQYPSAKAVYDFVNNTLGTIINGDY